MEKLETTELVVFQDEKVIIPAVPPSKNPGLMKMTYDNFLSFVEAEKTALHWAQKVNITDAESLKEADNCIKACKAVVKNLEAARKESLADTEAYAKQVKELEKNFAQVFAGVQSHLEAAKVTYNLKKEREAKAEQERIRAEAEALQRKAEADKKIREAQEAQKRFEEEEKLKKLEVDKIAQAQAAGRTETDQMEADIAIQEAQAKIDKERADRAEADRKQAALDRKDRDLKERQLANDMAKAKAAEKTKGVATKWTYDIEDPKLVIRDYCEPSKGLILAAVNNGLREKLSDGSPNPNAAGLMIFEEKHSVTR